MNKTHVAIRNILLSMVIGIWAFAAPAFSAEGAASTFGGTSVTVTDDIFSASDAARLNELTKSVDELTSLLDQLTKMIDQLEQAAGTRTPGDSTPTPPTAPTTSTTPASDSTAQAASSGGGTYTVVPGDSLWKIASRYLGNGARYWDLVEANKDKYPSLAKNPNLIYPGWELTIPGTSGNLSSSETRSTSSSSSTPSNASSFVANPNVAAPAAGARGGRALLAWLERAGLSGENLRMAWAIGMAESGGNPRAFNGNASTGDRSYGLFQINMLGNLGPARLRQYNLSSNEDLFDPETNIRVMLQMSNNCTNWQPWSVYKRGSYRSFYNTFPPQ
ncbi:MAG TPA: LysM peptidoglycan-binding domain-containing protein [Candidatus Ozemobacteraceae bacterium]|nr:LysM peptidoglycan-binding domain-containing protein [Candidatus Ozemobacteraceae bacterium]HQG28204.1 LysM peptidoglycan-binding domain-containing protein [Candidatus Ozemobacteraceae bacterium]